MTKFIIIQQDDCTNCQNGFVEYGGIPTACPKCRGTRIVRQEVDLIDILQMFEFDESTDDPKIVILRRLRNLKIRRGAAKEIQYTNKV